ncbi:MAG TPA: carbohydrate ABC transporter permease [Candidatus Gallimonas intestinavium]|uniref:Carbohydrate ABC transporter permease n=1 Tax=Candidatus Gallimonas intestinavium TaxID=2838603 RepID=A0A9D2G376_9FIRM|nr:carbohydrate ABC transporter permease [Candidatus Gallimonas intestinavium]
MSNEVMNNTSPAEEKQYSSFRYGLGAFLAFFGISSATHRASKKRQKLIGDILVYIVMLFGSFLMIYPFWWMIAGSFADTNHPGSLTDILNKLVWWPVLSTADAGYVDPRGLFRNYDELLFSAFDKIKTGFTFWQALGNNLLYSIVPVVVGVITSASAAFSFAKIEWIGRNAVFYVLLAAIMVPGPSIMTAQYAMYHALGWRENGLVLIIPGLFGSIMTAFFIRQFLFGLPTSIIEAAKIDGAGYFRIFCGFILPLAMPAIMAQGLLSFMGCWNNYMGSFIMIPSTSTAINLPHALALLDSEGAGSYAGDYAVVIAGSVLCVLPVMILFACFQKTIISSLMLTGSKE